MKTQHVIGVVALLLTALPAAGEPGAAEDPTAQLVHSALEEMAEPPSTHASLPEERDEAPGGDHFERAFEASHEDLREARESESGHERGEAEHDREVTDEHGDAEHSGSSRD